MKILNKIEQLMKFDKSENRAILLIISLVLIVTVIIKVIYQTSIDANINVIDTRVEIEEISDTTYIEDEDYLLSDTTDIDDLFDHNDFPEIITEDN